ncbi:MAG: FAD-linked oxidase C-terminal domain-containing protein, partial [Acidimicrobiales bacterium]
AVTLRAHPEPAMEVRSAWSFPSIESGLDALRRTLRLGATPAELRLYDQCESGRNFDLGGTNVLVALDEGHEPVIRAAMDVLASCCRECGALPLSEDLVERWLGHRNDVSALASVTRAGIVVDTIEVSAPWSRLAALYSDAISALSQVDGCLSASAHESHAYLDGACLYFTFAGRGAEPEDDDWATSYYARSWAAVMAATRRHGGSISHHHGIGMVRAQYLREALGEGFGVLERLKNALDPEGILNPGKLGLNSQFGDSAPYLAAFVTE